MYLLVEILEALSISITDLESKILEYGNKNPEMKVLENYETIYDYFMEAMGNEGPSMMVESEFETYCLPGERHVCHFKFNSLEISSYKKNYNEIKGSYIKMPKEYLCRALLSLSLKGYPKSILNTDINRYVPTKEAINRVDPKRKLPFEGENNFELLMAIIAEQIIIEELNNGSNLDILVSSVYDTLYKKRIDELNQFILNNKENMSMLFGKQIVNKPLESYSFASVSSNSQERTLNRLINNGWNFRVEDLGRTQRLISDYQILKSNNQEAQKAFIAKHLLFHSSNIKKINDLRKLLSIMPLPQLISFFSLNDQQVIDDKMTELIGHSMKDSSFNSNDLIYIVARDIAKEFIQERKEKAFGKSNPSEQAKKRVNRLHHIKI